MSTPVLYAAPDTLAAALAAARAGAGRTILLHGGEYVLAEPLRLGPEDRGLTLAAAPGENPILVGGRALADWRPEADGRLWSAPAAWDFDQLYVNGEARPPARLPETGTWQPDSTFDRNHDACARFDPPPTIEERSTLVYGKDQLPAGFAVGDALFVVLHIWDSSRARAVAHDPATRTLRLDPPCVYPPGALGVREYYVLNLREGLTRPGQWYLDRAARRVYYWPQPGEDPARCRVDAPVLPTAIHLAGTATEPVTDVTITGLTVDLTANVAGTTPEVWARALPGAVTLEHARDCRLAELTVRRAGGQGIKLAHVERVTVERGVVADVGANGIAVREAVDVTIAGNRVSRVGRLHPYAIGIHGLGTTALRIVGNEVTDCTYCGITLANSPTEPPRRAANLIADNHVANVMNALNDGGCIYVAYSQRDTVIRGNRLHGAHGRTGAAQGLYLDIDVEGVTCEGNVVYDVAKHALHLHMSRRNVVRGNIFVCGPGRGISLAHSGDCVFADNVVYGQAAAIVFNDPHAARFTGNVYWTAAGPPRFAPGPVYYGSQPFPHGFGEEVGHLAPLDDVPMLAGAPAPHDWERARVVDRFVDAHGNAASPRHRATVRLLRHDAHLHVRARLERPPASSPATTSVWAGEHFSFYLKPRREQGGYVQLGVAHDGRTAALWSCPPPTGFAWPAAVAPFPEGDGWEATLVIPLDELAAVFGDGPLTPTFLAGFAVANPPVDFAGWQALGHDPDGRVADPLFTAPETGDFRRPPNSPAAHICPV